VQTGKGRTCENDVYRIGSSENRAQSITGEGPAMTPTPYRRPPAVPEFRWRCQQEFSLSGVVARLPLSAFWRAGSSSVRAGLISIG